MKRAFPLFGVLLIYRSASPRYIHTGSHYSCSSCPIHTSSMTCLDLSDTCQVTMMLLSFRPCRLKWRMIRPTCLMFGKHSRSCTTIPTQSEPCHSFNLINYKVGTHHCAWFCLLTFTISSLKEFLVEDAIYIGCHMPIGVENHGTTQRERRFYAGCSTLLCPSCRHALATRYCSMSDRKEQKTAIVVGMSSRVSCGHLWRRV